MFDLTEYEILRQAFLSGILLSTPKRKRINMIIRYSKPPLFQNCGVRGVLFCGPGGEINVDPIEGEFFNTEAIASISDALVREAIQNCLDASLEEAR